MLQTQTVQPELLELLKALMSVELFNNFYVVGGTALALQVGHRQSIDIDLFGQSEMGIRRQWPTAKRQLLNSYAKMTISKATPTQESGWRSIFS